MTSVLFKRKDEEIYRNNVNFLISFLFMVKNLHSINIRKTVKSFID